MMDRNLYPFTTLQAHGMPDPLGDKAFDEDEDCGSTRPNGGSAATILLHKRLESGEEA
jgi:tRNA 2-thiocytidine biosynthesis protein TtcA